MKRLTFTCLALMFAVALQAQVEDNWDKKMKESRESAWKEYEDFKQQSMKEYEDFRRKANEEYAKFMAEAWKPFEAQPAEEIPWQPKPLQPVVAPEQPIQPVDHPIITPELPPITPEKPVITPEQPITPELPTLSPDMSGDVPESAYPEVDPSKIVVPHPTPDIIQSPDPIQVPGLDKPDSNIAPLPNKVGQATPIPMEGRFMAPKPIDRPQPIEPIKPNPMSATALPQMLYMYGSGFPFHIEKDKPLKLKDVSEKSVAKMWTELSDPKYDNIIAECLQKREECQLCDWAYVRLTQNVAEQYCGKGTDEAVVMQMYLLTQSGYQMRIGRTNDNRLGLLMGSREKIYRYKFFVIDGVRFYIINMALKDKGMHVFNHAFPKERALSLYMYQPKLAVDYTEERTLVSKRYPEMRATVETNLNLINFYDDCPVSAQWNYYSTASMSDVMKKSLYPSLRKAIEGKDELTAANMLLDFVQTGFAYKTDEEQFGYERPLYPDESFYYPYCDCEDRSILFSCLVRELLGLEVVLLDYPNHISTAVHFNQEVQGDYLMVDGKKFVISDPTYINAPVGCCSSKYRVITPDVVRVQ